MRDHALPEMSEAPGPAGLDRRQRDFALLSAHVLARQGRLEQAAALVEAVLLLQGPDPDALFAAAVLDFARGRTLRCRARLDALDRLDPPVPPRGPSAAARRRARRYLEARTAYALDLKAEGDAAIAEYLAAAPADFERDF